MNADWKIKAQAVAAIVLLGWFGFCLGRLALAKATRDYPKLPCETRFALEKGWSEDHGGAVPKNGTFSPERLRGTVDEACPAPAAR